MQLSLSFPCVEEISMLDATQHREILRQMILVRV
jgi:hypothetical protein